MNVIVYFTPPPLPSVSPSLEYGRHQFAVTAINTPCLEYFSAHCQFILSACLIYFHFMENINHTTSLSQIYVVQMSLVCMHHLVFQENDSNLIPLTYHLFHLDIYIYIEFVAILWEGGGRGKWGRERDLYSMFTPIY